MKPLLIALKDTRTRFRDWRALLYMLAAPLLIGLIMGAAFSGQNNGDAPIAHIPLAVVNADDGALGQSFVDILADIAVDTAEGSQPLFDITPLADADTARAEVESGAVRGAIILPENFSEAAQTGAASAVVTVLTDPTYRVAPLIIVSVARRITLAFESTRIGSQLAASQMTAAVQRDPARRDLLADFPAALETAQKAFGDEDAAAARIRFQRETAGSAQTFNVMSYFMPSMAIFFLMFAMFAGTRSILEEEKLGTLPRLMTMPVQPAEILLGKMGGTLLTGLLQMAVLVLVSGLLFGVHWGRLGDVALLTLDTVLAAAGLGALIAAFARDDNQAGILGTVFALVFGILGGNFIVFQDIPRWLDVLSKATLNRWALDGFTALAAGQASLADIFPNLMALLGMGAVFYLLALFGFSRRFTR